MVDTVDLMLKYKLTPAMASGLLLLLTSKMVTHRMLEVDAAPAVDGKGNQSPITTDGKVLIHRIRRRLAGTPVVIHAQRCVGYWLDQESKDFILQDLAKGQMSLPFDREGESENSPPLAA